MNRRAIALLAAGHFLTDLCQGTVPALLPFLVMERHFSYTAAASLVFAISASSSVVQPLFGQVADRLALAWLLPASILLTGAGLALGAQATTFALVLGQEYLPSRVGMASGVTLGLAVSVGGMAAPLLGRLADWQGLGVMFLALLVVVLVAMILSFALPSTVSRIDSRRSTDKHHGELLVLEFPRVQRVRDIPP
jgi:MFS transporter, FSR family, fosmidomycin resistance protein